MVQGGIEWFCKNKYNKISENTLPLKTTILVLELSGNNTDMRPFFLILIN